MPKTIVTQIALSTNSAIAGKNSRCRPGDRRPEHRDHDQEDDHVVGKDDELAPHDAVHVHADRRWQLFDQPFVGGEDDRAVEDGVLDEVPEDEPRMT